MNTTITIKTNDVLRDEAKKMADELGLTLTGVINAYLKQFVRERKFSVSASPMPSKERLALWEKISDDMDKGKGITGVFSDTSELMKHLRKC